MARGTAGKTRKRTEEEIKIFSDLYVLDTPSTDEEWDEFTRIYNETVSEEHHRTKASLRSFASRIKSKEGGGTDADVDTDEEKTRILTKKDYSLAIKREIARSSKCSRKIHRKRRSVLGLKEKLIELEREIDQFLYQDSMAARNHAYAVADYLNNEHKLANKPKRGRKKKQPAQK